MTSFPGNEISTQEEGVDMGLWMRATHQARYCAGAVVRPAKLSYPDFAVAVALT
jgi:hypothetical protein